MMRVKKGPRAIRFLCHHQKPQRVVSLYTAAGPLDLVHPLSLIDLLDHFSVWLAFQSQLVVNCLPRSCFHHLPQDHQVLIMEHFHYTAVAEHLHV